MHIQNYESAKPASKPPQKTKMTEADFSARDAFVSEHIVVLLKDVLLSLRQIAK